jgi:hypothetical protein
MSTMYGADVGQLRELARQFDASADRLDANRMTVGNAIRISAWVGPVAVRFRAQWDSDHSRRVHDAAERLRTAARALRANADDQARTSAASGGSGGSGGASAPGRGMDPSLVELAGMLQPHLEEAYDILTRFSSYEELIEFIRTSKLDSRLPIVSSITALYELARDGQQTWNDIQSGNIFRFGGAIFRTGWTAAKVIPGVGLVDTVWGLGIDTVSAAGDAVFGPGTSKQAFDNFGDGVAGIGDTIDAAGHRAGAAIASGIRSGAEAVARLFPW